MNTIPDILSPILTSNEDKLSFKKEIVKLFENIENIRESKNLYISTAPEYSIVQTGSVAVSINGKWGSGKTSFINLFLEFLHNKNPEIKRIYFNPWHYSNDNEPIITHFYRELSKILPAIVNSLQVEEFKKAYDEYVEDLIPVKPVRTLATWIKQFFSLRRISQSKTPRSELYQKLYTSFFNLDHPVYIFIDDADRLDGAETYELLKLIKTTSCFPNLVYIIAADKELISKNIESYTASSKQYLNKIFDYSFNTPSFASEQYLMNETVEYVSEDYDIERWNTQALPLFRDLSTLRNIQILKKELSIYKNYLDERSVDIDPIDLTLISTLRVFYPDFFEELLINREGLHFSKQNFGNSNFQYRKFIFLKNPENRKATDIALSIFPFIKNYLLEELSDYEKTLIQLSEESKKEIDVKEKVDNRLSNIIFSNIFFNLHKTDIQKINPDIGYQTDILYPILNGSYKAESYTESFHNNDIRYLLFLMSHIQIDRSYITPTNIFNLVNYIINYIQNEKWNYNMIQNEKWNYNMIHNEILDNFTNVVYLLVSQMSTKQKTEFFVLLNSSETTYSHKLLLLLILIKIEPEYRSVADDSLFEEKVATDLYTNVSDMGKKDIFIFGLIHYYYNNHIIYNAPLVITKETSLTWKLFSLFLSKDNPENISLLDTPELRKIYHSICQKCFFNMKYFQSLDITFIENVELEASKRKIDNHNCITLKK